MLSNLPRKYKPTMRWAPGPDGRRVPIFRDEHLCLVEAFTDYGLYLARDPRLRRSNERYLKLIEAVSVALKFFLIFLCERKLKWTEINDNHLWDFLEWNLARIRLDKRSKSVRTASRTSNGHVRRIFTFYYWAQEEALLCKGMIGASDSRITSTLVLVKKTGVESKLGSMYPVRFVGVGENSRTSDSQYWANDDDFREIEDYFWRKARDQQVAYRNVTLLYLLGAMGWRPSSLQSLTIDLFSNERRDEALRYNLDGVPVEPPKQKRDRGEVFIVPFGIYSAIRAYVDDAENGGRAGIISNLQARGRSLASTNLFLNPTTGQALTRQAIVDIFSDAFDAVGTHREGSATSLRRKFFMDINRAEIEFRRREHLSTAHEDVARANAAKMGHASITSQQAYNRAMNMFQQGSVEDRLRQELLEAQGMNAALRSKVATLSGMCVEGTKRNADPNGAIGRGGETPE